MTTDQNITSFDIVVVGGANYDYLVRGTRTPTPGETVDADQFSEAPGGKGANQAVAAARLGAQTAMIARVGMDDRGRKIVSKLIAEGVDTSHIIYDAEIHTGVALIMVDGSGQKQIMAAHGANRHFSVQDIHNAADIIAGAKVLVTQLEVPQEATLAAMRIAHDAGVRVVLDPAPPAPLQDAILPLVDIIRTNSTEAEAITGARISNRSDAEQAARELMQRGVGAVMFELSGEGNLIVWPDGSALMKRLPVESVDATGAGDALTAALAVALAEEQSWQETARFANTAAALATTVVGAQAGLPKRQMVEELLQTVAT